MRYKQPLSSYRFVSRPVVISAVPVGHLLDDAVYLENLPMWVYTARSSGVWEYHNDGIRVYTLEGTMFAGPTDMLIRGTKGELYPCKLDIFQAKYEPAPILI
jgi:hypothetical protein